MKSITGLNINGTRYDVTFKYGSSFRSLYGVGDPPKKRRPVFWGSEKDARKAQKAIIKSYSKLNIEITATEVPSIRYLIPYTRTGPGDDPAANTRNDWWYTKSISTALLTNKTFDLPRIRNLAYLGADGTVNSDPDEPLSMFTGPNEMSSGPYMECWVIFTKSKKQ